MSGISKRQLLLLAGIGALPGCGFQPVYMPTASGKPGVAQREFAAINVLPISDRPGQLMRQALQRRFEAAGTGVARRYDLQVAFWVAGDAIAIQSDSTVSRIRFVGHAAYTLVAQDPARTPLTSGSAVSIDAINILDTQYFASDMETSVVQQRLADALADQIAIQLAAWFRRRAAQQTT